MSSTRTAHTATLLQDGRVLLTGGAEGRGTEVFDPAADKFAVVTDEAVEWDSRAVPLKDGRVFFVGPRSAKTYDPAKAAYVLSELPLSSAEERAAVLLPSGKVLITGGWQCAVESCVERRDFADAQVYDPSHRTFLPAGAMACARSRHTATLLPNGTVLLVGGWGCPRAELYDPSTGAFTQTGTMVKVRKDHTATLLGNGSVLVVGGKTFEDQFLGEPTSELYDPSTGAFSLMGAMKPRVGHTATLLPNGKVLVAGALTGEAETNELYDPASGTFAATARLQSNRAWPTATLLRDGRVLIAGGITNLAEVYIPACE